MLASWVAKGAEGTFVFGAGIAAVTGELVDIDNGVEGGRWLTVNGTSAEQYDRSSKQLHVIREDAIVYFRKSTRARKGE